MNPSPRDLCRNLNVENGHLTFAGQDTVALAARFGTPLYLMDEDTIRRNCRRYTESFARLFPAGSLALYASKAASFTELCRIMQTEGMGLDVVSMGEIYTACKAGFPMEKVYFHSNHKTQADIQFALEKGVGCLVVDNEEELLCLQAEAAKRNRRQKVLLRITPGIDPHTYAAVATGQVDSKFGLPIETGQAQAFLALALQQPHLFVAGLHCHVGSQVFTEDVFERSAAVMLAFMADMREKLGLVCQELDLGGGYGTRYVHSDPEVNIPEKLRSLAAVITAECRRLRLPLPRVLLEPGRSIVADAGLTLYTVGSVKQIPGYRTYVSVDGGMTDNPRYALYGSRYTCYIANKMDEPRDMPCALVGRCCESGDVIQPQAALPASTGRGDLAAVCTTGAYNYSMASNYNRLPRPPVVLLQGGTARIAVRRETLEDIVALDV